MVTAFGRGEGGSQIPHAFVSMISGKDSLDYGIVSRESCLTDDHVLYAVSGSIAPKDYQFLMGACGYKQRRSASEYI